MRESERERTLFRMDEEKEILDSGWCAVQACRGGCACEEEKRREEPEEKESVRTSERRRATKISRRADDAAAVALLE